MIVYLSLVWWNVWIPLMRARVRWQIYIENIQFSTKELCTDLPLSWFAINLTNINSNNSVAVSCGEIKSHDFESLFAQFHIISPHSTFATCTQTPSIKVSLAAGDFLFKLFDTWNIKYFEKVIAFFVHTPYKLSSSKNWCEFEVTFFFPFWHFPIIDTRKKRSFNSILALKLIDEGANLFQMCFHTIDPPSNRNHKQGEGSGEMFAT